MRLNQFLARHTDLSRRKADVAIEQGRVEINGVPAKLGDIVIESDLVSLDSHKITPTVTRTTIMLYKPVGYVCSRRGQGSRTIYELLPQDLQTLNPVGRLDKDSSGLLVMTDDGLKAHELSHPSFEKQKRYFLTISPALTPEHEQRISTQGVHLDDGSSVLTLESKNQDRTEWNVIMHEGRNRQIRRTFAAIGYRVITLHRTEFGPYRLETLKSGKYSVIK